MNWCRVGPVAFERRMKRKKKNVDLAQDEVQGFLFGQGFDLRTNAEYLMALSIVYCIHNR